MYMYNILYVYIIYIYICILYMYNIIGLKITGVPKTTLFGLYYPRLMPKADPNRVWGGRGGRNVLVKYVKQ